MKFLAHLQNMSSSEILKIIPQDIFQEIKARDANPIFRAYVIGHEGEARPKAVGIGQIIVKFFKDTVMKLVDKLKYGLKFFHNHGPTNETEGRVAVGELVGKVIKNIKNKVSAVAIAYIYPDFKDLPLDIASVEADVELTKNENSDEFEPNVKEVTGIALGNSKIDKPGFANATLLSQIQAFIENELKLDKEQKWQLGFKIDIRPEDKIRLIREG